jgi:hypothetical protein
MNSTEAQVIESYLMERARMFSRNPGHAASRAFYELWEKLCCPQPFPVSKSTLVLNGTLLRFPRHRGTDAEGVYCWDEEEGCPRLRVRTADWEKSYLIRLKQDGSADWEEQETVSLTSDGVAEMIDAMREIARMMKEDGKAASDSKLKLKELHEYADRIADDFPESAVKAIKSLGAQQMHELIQSALADLAGDELDDQLVLPLDGTYAREHDGGESYLKNRRDVIGSETAWRVKQRLELIERSARLQAELERDFTLRLADASLLRSRDHELVVEIQARPDAPVRQDDVLSVARNDDGERIGFLHVDLADGDMIVGRIRTDRKVDFEQEKAHLAARMPKSPLEQYADSIRELKLELESGSADTFGAAAGLLGVTPLPFTAPPCPPPVPGNRLNAPQRAALEAACSGANKAVLIQGPPGTGKTHLLEQIVRRMQRQGLRILVGAPSHAAVDNLCRRIMDLPFLRCARNRDNVDPVLMEGHWVGTPGNYRKIRSRCGEKAAGIIFAGTLPGLLRDYTVENFQKTGTEFDVILIDEAGMAAPDEAILAARLANRIVLLGDHRQLPPFPRHRSVLEEILKDNPSDDSEAATLATKSIMEWLISYRKFPVYVLNLSYRCRNPRLLRFASTMFYNAELLPNPDADYYKLPPGEREQQYPKSTLQFISTSHLPLKKRSEKFVYENGRPGIWNPGEVRLAAETFRSMLTRYELEDITVISPYRRQIVLLRKTFSDIFASRFATDRWNHFLLKNIATVDSFQGGESEAVIISYVRSSERHGIGFTDNANRINVAYTRCRSELVIIGDLECLKNRGKNQLFAKLERAVERDGEIVFPETTPPLL